PTSIPDPRFTVHNFSSIGAIAESGTGWHGTRQLASALRSSDTDAIAISFGGNDLRWGNQSPAEVLEDFQAMKKMIERAEKSFFIATIAPYYGPNESTAPLILELNRLIREAFPAYQILEFHENFPAEFMASDGTHILPIGHRDRAARAAEMLYGIQHCRDGTPCRTPRLCFHPGNGDKLLKISGQSFEALQGLVPFGACVTSEKLVEKSLLAEDLAKTAWAIDLQTEMDKREQEARLDCANSDPCREIGRCAAVSDPEDHSRFICRPARHLHCAESRICATENRCRNWFGECIAEDPVALEP
ncbi:MAG: SGNH/GDSL hydrolase family protein, partial [bacterium]